MEEARKIRLKRYAEQHADEIREKCKTLRGFVEEGWRVLEPRARFIGGWHIDAICDHLEAVRAGHITRLNINVPPGSMKSLLVSVLFHAWEWGPCGMRSMRYLSTSFNDGPVKRDMGKTLRLIQSPWYQTLWPDVRLTRTAVHSFANSDTGSRDGVAFGSLTSQRGDRLMIDDPHSTETAESETERLATTRKFREGALDRLNDLVLSAIINIMQRLHQDDIAGVIQSMPELGFVNLIIPMRFEPARKCIVRLGDAPELQPGEPDPRPIFWQDPREHDGELMAPERFPAEAVDKLEIGKGDYAFAGQYQQRPAPREGGMFKVDQIEIVDHAPLGRRPVRGWDIAGSVKKTSPYTAGVRMREGRDGFLYIEDVKRKRAKIDKAEELIVTTAHDEGLQVRQSIPQDPGQSALSQKNKLSAELKGLDFKFSPESGSKEDRAIPLASQVNAGKVRMVRGEWNHDFIEELRNFPAGSFKDQVDAASRAYMEILSRPKIDDGVGAPRVPGQG